MGVERVWGFRGFRGDHAPALCQDGVTKCPGLAVGHIVSNYTYLSVSLSLY